MRYKYIASDMSVFFYPKYFLNDLILQVLFITTVIYHPFRSKFRHV